MEVLQTLEDLSAQDLVRNGLVVQDVLEPDVSFALSGCWSLFWSNGEHLLQQTLQFNTEVRWCSVCTSLDLVKDFLSAGTCEWQLTRHQHVQHASERPNVTLVSVVTV